MMLFLSGYWWISYPSHPILVSQESYATISNRDELKHIYMNTWLPHRPTPDRRWISRTITGEARTREWRALVS